MNANEVKRLESIAVLEQEELKGVRTRAKLGELIVQRLSAMTDLPLDVAVICKQLCREMEVGIDVQTRLRRLRLEQPRAY